MENIQTSKPLLDLIDTYNRELEHFFIDDYTVSEINKNKASLKIMIENFFRERVKNVRYTTEEIRSIIDDVFRFGSIRTKLLLDEHIHSIKADNIEDYQNEDKSNKEHRSTLLNALSNDNIMHPFADLTSRITSEIEQTLNRTNSDNNNYLRNRYVITSSIKAIVAEHQKQLKKQLHQNLEYQNYRLENIVDQEYQHLITNTNNTMPTTQNLYLPLDSMPLDNPMTEQSENQIINPYIGIFDDYDTSNPLEGNILK